MKRMNVKQSGMSAMGFIIILLLIGFFTMVALKVAPIYFENFKINSVLKSLKDENGLNTKTNSEITNIIAHRFIIENIERVKADQVKVKHDSNNKVVISLDYEIREDLFGNLSLIVSFDDSVELP